MHTGKIRTIVRTRRFEQEMARTRYLFSRLYLIRRRVRNRVERLRGNTVWANKAVFRSACDPEQAQIGGFGVEGGELFVDLPQMPKK